MSARDIVGGLAGAAVGAVKHPVGTANGAVSKARTAVGAGTAVGTAVAGTVFRRVRGDAAEVKERAAGAVKDAPGKAADTAKEATDKAAGQVEQAAEETAGTAKEAAGNIGQSAKKAARKAPGQKSPGKKPGARKTAPKREPQVVLAEPAPPALPPIDVVGEALAAEAQNPDHIGSGRTTEPRGASRDEEHGEAALQPAEVNEIAEEMAEVARAGNLDLSTPVGTTGADTGFNPDTAEADLQQPGTEPLVDPSLTNEVKSEQETLSEAAAPKKPKPKKS